MTKTLIKKQLLELFQSNFVDTKTGRAKSKGKVFLAFLAYALVLGILGVLFYFMAANLGGQLLNTDNSWVFFALMGMTSIALGLFGSVFSTYSTLYLPEDNELLLALPIPPKTLVISRVFGVYVTSLMYGATVWLPTCICYWLTVTPTVTGILFPLVLLFILPLFVTVLSCLLGFVVALISSKAKGKSVLSALAGMLALGLYYVIYFKISKELKDITQHLDAIKSFSEKFRFIYWISKGADGDAGCMAISVGIILVLAAVCYFILSKTLLKLVLSKGKGAKKSNRAEAAELRSPESALLQRELKHFTSESTWMLNGAMGLVLLVLLSVGMIVKGNVIGGLIADIDKSMGGSLAKILPMLISLLTCLVVSIDVLTPPALSMEGRTLWLLQTLPIKPAKALLAKSRMASVLTVGPASLFVIISCIALDVDPLCMVFAWTSAIAYVLMFNCYGLKRNIKNPNFIWTTASTVCKQGAPVFITMIVGMGLCIGMGIIGYVVGSLVGSLPVLIAYTVIFGGMWLITRHWITTKGAAIFASL